MDTVVEVLIKKKKTLRDYLCQTGLVILGLILLFTAYYFMPLLGMISVAIMFVVIWLDSRAVVAFNIEYEYTYVKGDIDIDRIFGKNTRRRYFSVTLSKIQFVSMQKNAGAVALMSEIKPVYICKDKNDGRNIVIVYDSENGRKLLVLENNDEVFEDYGRLIPNKVKKDEF